jgi:formamidopyrimidine-DNA glycosylase
MTFKLMPNINKLLDQMARDEGRVEHSLFQFEVVRKGREPCPVSGCIIERCVVQNRGSYFGRKCQPLSPESLI